MEEYLDKIYEYIAIYGLNLLTAVVIFCVGRWLARVVSNIIEKIMLKSKIDVTLATFVKNISFCGMIVFVIIASISKLGVETTSLVAMLGAAGLAVGLALQGSLANFAAGVLLIIFKPFKIGDLVDICGVVGTVKHIEIFNTTIDGLDNKKIIIPNAKITGDKIANLSAIERRRVDLVFGISYTDNIKTAKETLEKVVKENKKVLSEPATTIAVSELGDSSVNLVCRPWVKPSDYWDVYFDILERGKLALEANGITIPFPQSDIHLFEEKKIS